MARYSPFHLKNPLHFYSGPMPSNDYIKFEVVELSPYMMALHQQFYSQIPKHQRDTRHWKKKFLRAEKYSKNNIRPVLI